MVGCRRQGRGESHHLEGALVYNLTFHASVVRDVAYVAVQYRWLAVGVSQSIGAWLDGYSGQMLGAKTTWLGNVARLAIWSEPALKVHNSRIR
jgi:hypothetical protein